MADDTDAKEDIKSDAGSQRWSVPVTGVNTIDQVRITSPAEIHPFSPQVRSDAFRDLGPGCVVGAHSSLVCLMSSGSSFGLSDDGIRTRVRQVRVEEWSHGQMWMKVYAGRCGYKGDLLFFE